MTAGLGLPPTGEESQKQPGLLNAEGILKQPGLLNAGGILKQRGRPNVGEIRTTGLAAAGNRPPQADAVLPRPRSERQAT